MAISLLFSFFLMIMTACDGRQAHLPRGDKYNVKDNRDFPRPDKIKYDVLPAHCRFAFQIPRREDTDQSNRVHIDGGKDYSGAIIQDRLILDGSMLVQGYAPKKRRKRMAKIISEAALIGARAVRKILQGTKTIADSKSVMVYEKSGGYEQAFMDFHSLVQAGKLVKKRRNTSTGGNVGKVGDRFVSLEPGDVQQAILMITKPPADTKQRASFDVIVYKNE